MPGLNYSASEIQVVLDMGPEHEEDFFRIVVSGCVTSKHLNVSRDQLVAIRDILADDIVVEPVEHVGVPSIIVQPPETERWMVVDKNRTPVIPGMHRRENAESEAARLNDEGLSEFAPYRVVADTVATDLNS